LIHIGMAIWGNSYPYKQERLFLLFEQVMRQAFRQRTHIYEPL